MAKDISDVSQPAAGRFSLQASPVDLVPLIERAARHAGNRGASIRLEAPPEARGSWDSDRILSVIENLFTNAEKFSPRGAEIRVEIVPGEEEVLFRVQDEGEGIDPEHLEQIFEPFARLESASGAGGTGLGPYIARSIVEQHGGRIWADSAGAGTGSTFSFTLPYEPLE